MKELLRTNDIVLVSYVKTILDDVGIATFELDVNTSTLEGSIGILPRRVMVVESQWDEAVDLLEDQGIKTYHKK